MRSEHVILEANPDYWDKTRLPQVQRIIFDNTLAQHDAVELVKTGEGQVDVVTNLSPLETLRVAQSPFAKVVKSRGGLGTVFGMFNMRKPGSPWQDVRLRQAVNYAINRADLIRYATKGNGTVIPALVPVHGYGYDPTLPSYPFDPDRAQQQLQAAGYPDGLSIALIASEDLEVQATVVGKMLEHVGFRVERQMYDTTAYNTKIFLSRLEQPPEQQPWDIALTVFFDHINFPPFHFYHFFALDGPYDWVSEQPALRQLYTQVLGTVDREQQEALIRQMEGYIHDQAYFLFLYNPIKLYAVNKAVEFVPYLSGLLKLDEVSVSAQHWSVRKQKAAVHD